MTTKRKKHRMDGAGDRRDPGQRPDLRPKPPGAHEASPRGVAPEGSSEVGKPRRRRRKRPRLERGPESPRPDAPRVPRGVGLLADRRSAPTPLPLPVPLRPAREEEDLDDDLAEEEAPELGIGSRVIPPNVRFDAEVIVESDRPPSSARSGASPAELEAQIRALEARLDGLIRRASPPGENLAGGVSSAENGSHAPSLRQQVGEAALDVFDRFTSRPPAEIEPGNDPVATEYVERQWGREALRNRLEDVDDFGLDPIFEQRLWPGLDLLYRRYFRVQVEGIEHVPAVGRAVVVANHGGTVPLDGAMLRAALRLDHPHSRRDLRWMAEDFVFYLPFAGVLLNRIGAVRACQENAERLLEKDHVVAVFPEGIQGVKKLFRERYRLQRFGRGGYIRLCLRTRAPLVPCAIIGSEETNPLMYRLDTLAEIVKLPYLPITPTFPLFGPLGLLPAPTRWKLKFGEPISFDNYGPEAADDHVLVGRLSERVRSAIQALLDTGLRERKSVWFG